MSPAGHRFLVVVGVLALGSGSVQGGTYVNTVSCSASGCVQGQTQTSPPQNINAVGIVHAFGYNGAAATYPINICADALPSTGLEAATEWAVDMWNLLLPTTENCFRCATVEEGDPLPITVGYSLANTIVHELGHCALGLDHGNRNWNADGVGDSEDTSFTRTFDAIEILVGADGIRGSYDDFQDGLFGDIAAAVFWYKNASTAHPNDPVTPDSTIIDQSTYTRSVTVAGGLPPGHDWSANANRRVAESFGYGSTQSVMYSSSGRGEIFNGLSADDVSTVRMARTGVDRVAGTSDDYSVALTVVPCASSHEVRIRFVPLTELGPVARCRLGVDFAYPQNPFLAKDYRVVVGTGFTRLEIEVNSDYLFETAVPFFGDGFGSGNAAAWSEVSP